MQQQHAIIYIAYGRDGVEASTDRDSAIDAYQSNKRGPYAVASVVVTLPATPDLHLPSVEPQLQPAE